MTVRARHTPREKVEYKRYVGLGTTWLSVMFEPEDSDNRCLYFAQKLEGLRKAEVALAGTKNRFLENRHGFAGFLRKVL